MLGIRYDHRQAADYGGEVTVTDLASLVEDVSDFLDHIAGLVDAAEADE